jgi:hypothetical protein
MNSNMSTAQLARHVELAASYAAQAGVLRDAQTIALIRRIESMNRRGRAVDPTLLLEALDQLSRMIAPITLADLASGRDPFSPENLTLARRMQGLLTLAALLVLVMVGLYMHWVNLEQGALQQLTETQTVHAQLMLTELRRMAQFNAPAGGQGPLNDEYHRKIEELRQANTQLNSAYRSGLEAADIPYYPLEKILSGLTIVPTANAATLSGEIPHDGSGVALPASPVEAGAGATNPPNAATPGDICAEDASGRLRLPASASSYPEWIRTALGEALSDMCFQINIVSPDGDGALPGQYGSQLKFISIIRGKLACHVDWFLPFLFGLLGSIIFAMRNINNVRTPAEEPLRTCMRLFLGGIAGVAIGWFVADPSGLKGTGTISTPFILAFITGYAVDVLFSTLDGLKARIVGATK